jgi:2-polyprenyl-6-methoxyphenol hydroxylase-like FAD-dependent oxidoreductase
LSLWRDTADDDVAPRAALPGPAAYDVAVVGAGFTGLWTAYYLKRADPSLRVVVLEADLVSLPWVNHRSRPWEPEPLRWLGINDGPADPRVGPSVEPVETPGPRGTARGRTRRSG